MNVKVNQYATGMQHCLPPRVRSSYAYWKHINISYRGLQEGKTIHGVYECVWCIQYIRYTHGWARKGSTTIKKWKECEKEGNKIKRRKRMINCSRDHTRNFWNDNMWKGWCSTHVVGGYVQIHKWKYHKMKIRGKKREGNIERKMIRCTRGCGIFAGAKYGG